MSYYCKMFKILNSRNDEREVTNIGEVHTTVLLRVALCVVVLRVAAVLRMVRVAFMFGVLCVIAQCYMWCVTWCCNVRCVRVLCALRVLRALCALRSECACLGVGCQIVSGVWSCARTQAVDPSNCDEEGEMQGGNTMPFLFFRSLSSPHSLFSPLSQ
jgi:hypothetical protein